ncbi:MAG: acyl-CoA-binding protein [Candidatus Hydrogenedentes bacterium]|nr:acyl-CoA-binding protein [Candidatus Hydrogenedentota bacterium]
MTAEISAEFSQAAEDVKKLSERPDNLTMLRLYALYKQGSQGNCTGARPGMMDFVGRAKYDAWKALEGTSPDEAMKQYIELVRSLKDEDKKK